MNVIGKTFYSCNSHDLGKKEFKCSLVTITGVLESRDSVIVEITSEDKQINTVSTFSNDQFDSLYYSQLGETRQQAIDKYIGNLYRSYTEAKLLNIHIRGI